MQCFPMEKAWNPNVPGWCNNLEAHLVYGGLPNTATDIAMLILPIPTIWKLKAERHVKVGLMATFLVGSL